MSRAAKARDYWRTHPDAKPKDVAKLYGITERNARHTRQQVCGKATSPAASAPAEAPPPARGLSFEEKGAEGVASSCSTRIKTLDQLLAAAKVDLAIWEVERHVINKWEVAMREPATTVGGAGNAALVVENEKGGRHTLWTRGSHVPLHEELFQIKVWLRRKSPQVVGLRASLTDLLDKLSRRAPPPRPVRYARLTGECLAEIDIPDLHLGKLCWAQEAGQDYDVSHAEELFREALARHRDGALAYGVARFLLPIGNDYLNSDNAAGTTTAGTPQNEDGRWQRSYIRGRELMEWGIEYLREKAPVDVVQVPGNHDFERGFYLADALACIYRRQKDVTVDNAPTNRKYYHWGNTLLGLTHGDKEVEKDLPLTMAVERPDLWAATKFREFHCGHIHHKKQRVFQPVLEQKGIIVRHLSALTAADAWHAGKGYRAQRASSCFIHHLQRGCIAELSYSLETV